MYPVRANESLVFFSLQFHHVDIISALPQSYSGQTLEACRCPIALEAPPSAVTIGGTATVLRGTCASSDFSAVL